MRPAVPRCLRDEGRFEQRALVARRHFRPHGFGGWNGDGTPHRRECTGEGGDEGQDRGASDDTRWNAEQQHRKAEERVVDPDEQVAHRRPEDHAEEDTGHADCERELEIVPADRAVAVTQRLERGDLRPLQRQRARQRDVQDEGGDGHEDQRQHEAERLELRHLVGHHPVRDLQRARDRATPAVRFEDPVEARDDVFGGCARSQREHDVVEAALHVKRGGQRLLVHPEDAVAPVVGHHFAWPDAVDVLGRERDADNRQVAEASVEDRRHVIAQLQLVGDHEAFAGEHLVGTSALDPSASPQEQIVDERPTIGRDRHEHACRRLIEVREVQRDAGDDARFDGRHVRDRRDLRGDAQRRPLERAEDVPESLPLVVHVARPQEGIGVRQVHDVHRDAGRDHHRDRERLSLHRE